jgi:precorrin-6Y C5,15-methyltransferase (decarboxylating)
MNSGGRFVANVVSIQSLDEVTEALSKKTSQVDVWMVNISRGKTQLDRLRFEALPPTFVVAAAKP